MNHIEIFIYKGFNLGKAENIMLFGEELVLKNVIGFRVVKTPDFVIMKS